MLLKKKKTTVQITRRYGDETNLISNQESNSIDT